MTEVVPQLFIGTRFDAEALGAEVPAHWLVISVTEYRARYGRAEELPNEPTGALDVPFMLEGTASPKLLDAIAEAIACGLDAGRNVLVHCVHAHERSPLAVAWYLVWSGQAGNIAAAYELVQRKHPRTERRDHWLVGAEPTFGARPKRDTLRGV